MFDARRKSRYSLLIKYSFYWGASCTMKDRAVSHTGGQGKSWAKDKKFTFHRIRAQNGRRIRTARVHCKYGMEILSLDRAIGFPAGNPERPVLKLNGLSCCGQRQKQNDECCPESRHGSRKRDRRQIQRRRGV